MIYYHDEVKEKDKDRFVSLIHKEIQDQLDYGNLSIVKINEVPKDKKIHKTVWKLKQKRNLVTGEIKNYKARLKFDG